MTKDEALRLALEKLTAASNYIETLGGISKSYRMDIENLKAALEAKDEPWTPDDTAYRPDGLPQEFIKHEVELPEDWSEWVCPNPDEYFMKCCDCGLVHEMQFKVAKYSEGDECEFVEDANLQAVFRARRTTPPQRTWVGLTTDEKRDLCRSWSSPMDAIYATEAKLKEKNT